MFDIFLRPESWLAIGTLTLLEVVLGIDNIVFIAIIASRLPLKDRDRARKIGLVISLLARLLMLFGLSWIIGMEEPLFTLLGLPFSGRSLLLLAGGLFLMVKATREIYTKTEGIEEEPGRQAGRSFAAIIAQIILIDIIFSLDSMITAIGMVGHVVLIAVAIIITITVMFFAAGAVAGFIERHPSIKLLALSFLLMIGVLLVAEGTGHPFNKGYVYFAMIFALLVESLEMRMEKNLVARTGEQDVREDAR